jgi:hypothetical protein
MSRKAFSTDSSVDTPSLIDKDYFGSPSFNSPSSFTSSSFHSPPSKSRKKREVADSLSNARGISKEADRALLEFIAGIEDPSAIKLEQLASITPALSRYATKKVRNRYDYLLKIRNDHPLRFRQTCQNYSINFTPIKKEQEESTTTARLQSPVVPHPVAKAPPIITPVKVKARMNREASRSHSAAAERKSY